MGITNNGRMEKGRGYYVKRGVEYCKGLLRKEGWNVGRKKGSEGVQKSKKAGS